MTAPKPVLQPADSIERRQRLALVRQLALRLDAIARQVLIDVERQQPFVSNGRKALDIAIDLHGELKAAVSADEAAAKAARAARARKPAA